MAQLYKFYRDLMPGISAKFQVMRVFFIKSFLRDALFGRILVWYNTCKAGIILSMAKPTSGSMANDTMSAARTGYPNTVSGGPPQVPGAIEIKRVFAR
ncbi:hypothetical protein [Oscillibacter sp.]|uniref:hypothetical protein n=1 Tax=Oscillibacter sp. TaxID=1945593 RepID=UPI002626C4DD|nr:hypothetical protein [Oscillibacter sp.]